MGIMGERARSLFSPWRGLPPWARIVLGVYAVGFLEGVGAHLKDLATHGLHAYAGLSPVVRALFFSLVFLDAAAATLALRAHPAVVPFGAAIMVADLAANWWVNARAVAADPGLFWAPVGLLPTTLFGVFVVSAGFPLWRLLSSRRPALAAPQIS